MRACPIISTRTCTDSRIVWVGRGEVGGRADCRAGEGAVRAGLAVDGVLLDAALALAVPGRAGAFAARYGGVAAHLHPYHTSIRKHA